MASITRTCNGTRGQYFNIDLIYVENSTDTANNTSNITLTGKIRSNNSYYSYYGYTSTGVLTIDGTQVATGSSSAKVDTNGVTLVTYTGNIAHNSDGTKAITIGFDFTTTYGNLSATSESTSWTLTTIPRKSNATLSSNTFNIGSSITLTTNRASSSFTHTVVLTFGSYSKTYSNVGASQVINTSEFASNMYAQIPNSKSGTGTITTTTYSGSTNIGSSSINFTANAVESACKPTISNYSYTVDSTTSSLANNTTFIANVTTATVSITASRNQYSTLKKTILCYVNNGTIINIVTGDINSTGGTFTLTLQPNQVRSGVYVGVQDSRGFITYAGTIPTTFKSYITLTADQSAQIARTNQTEAVVKITEFNGNYWNDSFRSGNANTLTVQWRYKESTASSWSSYYTIPSSSITIANNAYTISNYTLTDGSTTELFDYQKAWNIQFSVTDKVGTKTSSYTITAGVPNFAVFPSHVLFNGNYVNKLQADLAFRQANYGINDISDWNNLYDQKGKYMGANKTNSPTARTTSGWWYVDQHRHLDSYRKQIAYAFSSENNNIYVRDKSAGTWSKWDAVKTETTMHYNPDMPSTGVWTRVCRIVFNEHVQGEFCYVRIYIAPGQNGYSDQNAYIDLVMQLGWTGSNYGRLGCNAELHAFNSVYTLSNTNIKVIANSNTDYYVWVYTSYAYNRVNYTANSGVNCNIWDAFTTQSTEPTGTACNLEYRNNGMAVGSINGGADRYVKYDSGLMECYGTFSATVNITSAFGNGYFYEFTSYHNYAQTFTWAPVLNVNVYATSGLYTFSINGNTTTGFKGYVWTCRSTSNQALTIHYHATGFWK